MKKGCRDQRVWKPREISGDNLRVSFAGFLGYLFLPYDKGCRRRPYYGIKHVAHREKIELAGYSHSEIKDMT